MASLKSEVDKLGIDKLEKVSSSLNSLKSKVDKLNVNTLLPVPVDFKKVSNVAKKEVVKKAVYDELAKVVTAIDTNKLVKKTGCNAKINEIEDKIPSVSYLVKKSDYNAKINEIKSEIPSVSDLVKKANYYAKIHEINGKIPNVSDLVKKQIMK